jgi:hypothetical protein
MFDGFFGGLARLALRGAHLALKIAWKSCS